MTITLNLDPDKEACLRRQAARRGQDVADYLLSPAALTEEDAPRSPEPEVINKDVLPQGWPEWEQILMSMGRGRTDVSLFIEATSRESIYEDDPR